MQSELQQKVRAEHLQRNAYLYIRQSSLRQVAENTESTARQYDLRQRAVALGWRSEQVIVIDSDQGLSAASARDRDGFQQLVADVSMARAGVVMGLEVSRLARNSSDWHRLLEICALTETLILDEDGLYDPLQINDRLLLGLKGTMSEAELHLLRARLRGGMLQKARRGELEMRLPVGFVYDPRSRVLLNPDKQVQESVRSLFDSFHRVGSAEATVGDFRRQGLRFPKRMHCGPNKGAILWQPLTRSRAVEVLHNPRYAGAYAYGRRTMRVIGLDRRVIVRQLPREKWHTLIPNAHAGYISWEEFERNQQQLAANARGLTGRKCPPREGPALLQGLAVCAVCGMRMTVRYHHRRGTLNPDYVCPGQRSTSEQTRCQSVPGDGIDRAIDELVAEVMNPAALELSLAVQQEVCSRIEETDRLRYRQVERAQYEADLARRRYMQVDPDNRLVVDELEAEWNRTLRELAQVREEYERRRQEDRLLVDDEMRSRILALARDFPRVWKDPKTPHRERKRMVRLIVEDATIRKDTQIVVHVRFKGGATRSLTVRRPRSPWEEKRTPTEVVSLIDRLMDDHTPAEIAGILAERGVVSGCEKRFDGERVRRLCRRYGLKTRWDRLRDAGMMTLRELAARLELSTDSVKRKRAAGTLPVRGRRLNDEGEYMYEDPGPTTRPGRRRPSRRPHS